MPVRERPPPTRGTAASTAWCVVSVCRGVIEMRPRRMAWMSDISSLTPVVLALLDPVVRAPPRIEALEDRALVLAPALHGDRPRPRACPAAR